MKTNEVSWRKAAPAPVILVFGPQQYLASRVIREVREQLAKKLGSIEVERISASDYRAGQIADLAAPSLFAQPKFIIIEDVQKCTDELITEGIAYLSSPESDVTLALLHDGSSVRGKKLLEAIRQSANAIDIAVPKLESKDREAFIAAEFQAASRQAHPQAVRAIADAFGESIEEAVAACEQLMQDVEGTITQAVVDQYYGGRVEASTFKMMDAAWNGRKVQALEYLRHIFGSGNDRVMLVQGMAKQIREVAKLFGNPSGTLPGLTPWQTNQRRVASAGWTEDSFAKLVSMLAEADAATKGASRDPEYVIEQLVLFISNKGK